MSTRKSAFDKSTKTTDWLAYRLGGPRATFLGHVTAPNQETALAKAYDEFGIASPRERQKIIVRPTSRAE